MIRFTRAVLKLPVPVQLWLLVLAAGNAIVPLFYLSRLEAQVVLGTFFVAAFLMGALTHSFGFTRILGLGHFPWFLLIPFLWMRLPHIPADGLFGMWVRAVMALNGASLLLDVADVVRYVRGDRAEIVEGL